MVIKDAGVDELTQKMLEGMRRAIKKLVEEKAAINGSLVIGDGHGNIKTVPAKELLPLVQEQSGNSL